MSAIAGTLQAIVVVPSRELAMQIMRVGQAVLPNEARGCVQQAIGGANPRRQVCALFRMQDDVFDELTCASAKSLFKTLTSASLLL